MVCEVVATTNPDNTAISISFSCTRFGATALIPSGLVIGNPPPSDLPALLESAIESTAQSNPVHAADLRSLLTGNFPLLLSTITVRTYSLSPQPSSQMSTLIPSRSPPDSLTPIFVPDPFARSPRIGIIGDSITQIGGRPRGYVGILQSNLPGSRVESHGIVGNRTGEMVHRFGADILAHNYNIIIIEGGVNDLPAVRNRSQIRPRVELIERNLTRMIDMVRESDRANRSRAGHENDPPRQIILLTVMPWSEYGTSSSAAQEATNLLNQWILAQHNPQAGMRVVNLAALGEADPRTGFLRLRHDLSMDHLHPINYGSYHGQTEIARLILQQAFGITLTEPQSLRISTTPIRH
ncbi:SGNH/GDSL hydrolase family protein [Candidatus Micrarchaeota archaeon]|nr:SGNH/GDSL hydrolase family protein [Candidatus Micrarchaeota archaeon]